MQANALLSLFPDLQHAELTAWVERGWVQAGDNAVYQEIDVARVRLIRDLRRDMGMAEDAIPVVLSLLDQVYELRGTLRDMCQALGRQPEDVRNAVLGAMHPRR